MKKILLTGNKGFIGKNIEKFLLDHDEEFEIITIEKDFYRPQDWEVSLDETIKSVQIVLHVGADSNTLNTDIENVMFLNFLVSKKIFDLAEKYKIPVVYSSSAACNGVNGYPSNLYSWSKFAAEQYGIKNNKEFIALRYFNVFGPGEEKKGKMSSVAYQSWGKESFVLFPKKPSRDFIYIKDVVEATTFPIFKKVNSGIYDVGTGESRTFEEVLNGLGVEIKYSEENIIPHGYQYFTKADKNKFMDGWTPKFNLSTGLKDYINYLNQNNIENLEY